MFKIRFAVIGAAVAALAAPALAQTPSESTRWLVPLNVGDGAKTARISAYNIGVRTARVTVVTLLNGQRHNSEQILLQPGQSVSFPDIANPTNFAVIVTDEPVIASATVERVASRVQNPFKVVEPSDPGQVTLQNQQSNQILRGYFIPYTAIVREDVRALPLNCEGAPAGHFACSINLPRENVVQRDIAPRPTETVTPAPSPQQQEGRYTRAHGVTPQ